MKKKIKNSLPPKVYALVGRSGTGKSFRAQFVAKKYGIKLIIDDGLLIKRDRIISGKSAKQESNFLTAVKRALFQDPEHCQEIIASLDKEIFFKILIIATSEKMAKRISAALNLPEPKTIINIEDIATKEEIETALKNRYTEGKHVIPVSPQQITRAYPHIVYDSIRVLETTFGLARSVSEKTVVKPVFSKIEQQAISATTFSHMIAQSLDQYSETLKLINVSNLSKTDNGYSLEIELRTPFDLSETEIFDVESYLSEALEKYGNIMINSLKVVISVWE